MEIFGTTGKSSRRYLVTICDSNNMTSIHLQAPLQFLITQLHFSEPSHFPKQSLGLVQSKVLVAWQSTTRAIDTPIEIKGSFKTPMQQSLATSQR